MTQLHKPTGIIGMKTSLTERIVSPNVGLSVEMAMTLPIHATGKHSVCDNVLVGISYAYGGKITNMSIYHCILP